MNKIKAIAFGAIIFALLACEQPFKAGLGPVVDIRDPTLKLTSPGAGSYIFGPMKFTGTAEDDYILSKVEIKVTNRPEAEYPIGTPYLQEYTRVNLRLLKQNEGVWDIDLVTAEDVGQDKPRKVFPEGDLKIKLKVTDSVGKWSETDEIVFQVKNDPPAISMVAPFIMRGNAPGNVGGPHLNYYVNDNTPIDPNELPSFLSYPRKADKKSYLNGTINDDQGVYTRDSGSSVEGNFYPQYRIWRIDLPENRAGKIFKPGYLPSEEEVRWVDFGDDELFAVGGMGSYQFAYELPDATGNFYGFEVRAHSIDKDLTEFYYPRDYYPRDYFNNPGNGSEDWGKLENRYVLIYIKAPESTPTIDFFTDEDIFGELSSSGTYKSLNLNDNQPHPYLNQLKIDDKNGPFTLRLMATHQGGVSRAEVYWQRDGSDPVERGRFIWDPADKPIDGTDFWNGGNLVSTEDPYSYWGYVDRISPNTARNFIFTYDHKGNDRIPAGSSYNQWVRGRSRIQKFIGNDAAWEGRKNAFPPWSNTDTSPSRWEDMDKLGEGFYNIEVYATSTSGTGMNVPASRTVHLDWTPPEMGLNSIEGEYGPADSDFPVHSTGRPDASVSVVNGMIKPFMRIDDNRYKQDTGVRVGTVPYFLQTGGVYAEERLYILVKESDNASMIRLINTEKNWWPPVDNTNTATPLTLTGSDDVGSISITASKHGVLEYDKTFTFLTSSKVAESDTNATGALDDGDYWLYVFARDNAFNVGSYSKKLAVHWRSDLPRYDFSIGNPPMDMVKKADAAFDDTDEGFWILEGTRRVLRNKLKGGNQEIKIKISDDDSLDMGTSSATYPSGIEMWFSTTTQDGFGTVTVPVTARTKLADGVVKQIFGTQTALEGTSRLPKKSTEGTIKQTQLLGNAEGRLPDGIYRLEITASDFADAKMGAGVASKSVDFWFVVNDNAPVFTPIPVVGGTTTFISPPEGKTNISALKDTGISGTVSAVNGPITISYTLTREGETTPPRVYITGAGLEVSPTQVVFKKKLSEVNLDGKYTLRLTATDRFGEATTVTQVYEIDEAGPVVTRRVPMQRVDRSNFNNNTSSGLLVKNGLDGIDPPTGGLNLARLANGVVSVTLRAFDPSGVKNLKYWLLKDPLKLKAIVLEGGVTVPDNDQLGEVWDYDTSYTSGYTSANSRFGESGSNVDFNAFVFRINTDGLDEGVYNLYAMAIDEADNYSIDTTTILDTIYVRQNSDLPFFGALSLDGKSVGKGGAVISGTIYDDDGFQDATGEAIRAGSIRIWMSQTAGANGVDLSGNGNGIAGSLGYSTPVIIPVTSLSSIGNAKSIGLNINLETYFSAMFNTDGQKHFVIEATDSAYTKFLVNGDRADTLVSRRLYYTFGYDNNPPKIHIDTPEQNSSIGKEYKFMTGSVEGLTGYIQDANLVQSDVAPDYHYYFKYKLNDDTRSYNFVLQAGEYTTETRHPLTDALLTLGDPTGETRVKFAITGQARIEQLLYQERSDPLEKAKLLQGENTLWLIAVDKSDKTANYGLKFSIDTEGPTTYLGLKEVSQAEISLTDYPGFSWSATPNETWYSNRRELLDRYDVPIIQRADGDFHLNGTFRDEASNIRSTYTYGFDSEVITLRTGTIDPVTLSKNASWKVNLKSLPDGPHFIHIRATDVNGNSKDSKKFAFRINSGQPTVAFAPGMPPSGSVVLGRRAGQLTSDEIFTVEGTAASPNLENVNLLIRHTALAKTAGYKPFELNLVPKRDADGNFIAIPNVNNNWTFTAISYTPSPQIEPPLTDQVSVTENLAWSLVVTRANLNTAGGNDTTLLAGTYEVAIVSTDMYGGSSDEAVWSFTVDKTPPTFTFSRLVENASATITPFQLLEGTPTTGRTVQEKTLQVADPVVSVRIQDAGSNLTTVQRQIRKWNYLQSRWEYYSFPITAPDTGTGEWILTETWAQTPAVAISGQDSTVDWDLKNDTTGLKNLEDGFYSIRYRAKDSAVINTPAAPEWAANTANGSTDNGNPATSNYLYFFYANNRPELDHVNAADRTYSSASGPVSLSITANKEPTPPALPPANNRFHKLDVEVESVNTGEDKITVPTIYGTDTGLSNGTYRTTVSWTPVVEIPIPSTYKEGSYRVTFTLTDLAGRSRSINRVIYLDNNPPTGAVSDPRFVGEIRHTGTNDVLYKYASEIQIGGETVIVNGTAQDVSGIKEIWFHLGYGQSNTTSTSFPSLNEIRTYWGNDPAEPPAKSAWFKYDTDGQTRPNENDATEEGFPYIDFAGMDPSNLYRWSFTMTTTNVPFKNAVAYYASTDALVNGQVYNSNAAGAPGPWMVRPIPTENLPLAYQRSGLYSLPLWVRIVDIAGNVAYTQRDIWIYPNGDYPETSIINPGSDTSRLSPRGGQIIVEGQASDNKSVRTVIYRVKADAYTNNNEGFFDKVAPADSDLITAEIGPMPVENHTEYQKIKDFYEASGAGTLGVGWYVATPETRDYGQTVPWSFTLNAGGEFVNIIRSKGFNSGTLLHDSTNTANNDMVRLWVEMYVFDDSEQGSVSYNLMSLGDGTVGAPKPFVRVFYLKDSSPKISAPRVNNVQNSVSSISTTYELGKIVRRGQFAIQATLSGERNPINQISVRLPQEAASTGLSTWRTARTGLVDQGLAGITIAPDTSGIVYYSNPPTNTIISGYEKYTITYRFDTATGAVPANFQRVMQGDWAAGGGNYTIDIRIRDNGNPYGQDLYSMVIGVDNYAPFADTVKQVTNPKVAGSNVAFMGRVFDYHGTPISPAPPNRGIQEVRVWFTKGRAEPTDNTNTLIHPGTGAELTGTTTTAITARINRTAAITYDGGGTSTTIASISAPTAGTSSTTVRYPTATNVTAGYVKVLNETTASTMENRITWQPTQNHDIFWSFIADTTGMPDGWITMHYVVEDTVGNLSYYTQYMVVRNKYPEITDIVLFTNNDGTGAVFTTHEGNQAFSEYRVEKGYGTDINRGDGTYLNSGFISKNRVIGFGVNTIKTGNFPLYYQALYVQRYEIPLTDTNLQAMANNRGGLATLSGVRFNGATVASVDNIVNLYTIGADANNDTNLDSSSWITLGAREANPVKGNHFVFQASLAEVGTMNEPSAFVYGYRQVFAPKAEISRASSAVVTTGDGAAVNGIRLDVHPDNLNYNNVAGQPQYFGTGATQINEFKGSQPERGNGPATDGTANNPYATAFFIIKVRDSVAPITGTNPPPLQSYEMLYDAVVIGMNVFIADGVPPTIQLYDLNPYAETAVTGYNIGDLMTGTNVNRNSNPYKTRRNAAAPTAIGYNVLRGGLFNIKTERDVGKSGYIDPRGGTTALQPGLYPANQFAPPLQQNALGYVTAPGFGNYTDDSNTATIDRDQVSGTIILRGVVHDDQLIDEIRVRIGPAPDPATPTNGFVTILKLQPVQGNANGEVVLDADGNEVIVAAGTANSINKMVRATNNIQAWAFEELHWKTGHTVEWACIWDTSTNAIGATAALANGNITIYVQTKDKNGADGVGLTNLTDPTRNLTVVPYVTGFTRNTLPPIAFTTTRSRQGWYSFSQGEQNITVNGFNLGTAALTVQLVANNTSTLTSSYAATTGHRFNIRTTADTAGTTLNSGRINISLPTTPTATLVYNTAATLPAYVNKSWNREYSAYTSGSELWINRPHAHIWRSNQVTNEEPATAIYNSNGSSSPSFSLQYVTPTTNTDGAFGRLHAAYAIYGNAAFYYGHNGGDTRIQLGYASEPYMATDIDYLNLTGSADNRQNRNVVTSYWGDSLAILKIKTIMATGLSNESTFDNTVGSTGNANTPHIAWHTLAANPSATDRFQNNRIRKRQANGGTTSTTTETGNAGSAYVTSYDSVYNRLLFVPVTGRQTTENGIRDREVYLDGANAVVNTTATNNNRAASTSGQLTNGINNNNTAGTIVASQRAGRWSAVDWMPNATAANQYPVVAYYDESNDTLRLAYARNATNYYADPTAGANWTRRYVFPEDHALRRGSGTYVSMKIADDGIIHLAFFNSTYNTVVYAKSSSNNPIDATFTAYTVDSVVKGGAWTDISLDDGRRPWIVYANSARTGNYDGARIAYLSTDFTRPLTDEITGNSITGWEALSMPAGYRVNDDRLNIAAWPPNNRSGADVSATGRANSTAGARNSWNAAVGYGSDMFRIAYFYKPLISMTGW